MNMNVNMNETTAGNSSHAQAGSGQANAYGDGLDELGLEFDQIKALLSEQVTQMDTYWAELQAAKELIATIKKRMEDDLAKTNRWKNQYEAVRAERDEYYGRLLRLSRGEHVDNPAAPAALAHVEEPLLSTGARRGPLSSPRADDEDELPAADLEVFDFFKDYVPSEPNQAMQALQPKQPGSDNS